MPEEVSIPGGSTLPLSGSFVTTVINEFAMKPEKGGDPSWEFLSVGVGKDSIVASDSRSAILIGRFVGHHDSTLRNEALVEAFRAKQYGEPVRLDDIERNVDSASGEVRPMPDLEILIRQGLSGMKHIAALDPAALVKVGKVAMAAGASSVELYQPENGQTIGFKFTFWPEEGHTNLFHQWEEQIPVQGVVKTLRSTVRDDDDEQPELPGEAPTTPERRTRRKKKDDAEPVIEEVQSGILDAIKDPLSGVDVTLEHERGAYRLPALGTLDKPVPMEADPGNYGPQILGVLRARGLTGRIVGTEYGPSVTLYKLEVPAATAVKKLIGLGDDFQVQLAVRSVIIQQIPGEKALGIQIPNKVSRTVSLVELCALPTFTDSLPRLTVALGQDIGGRPIYGDLAAMPHLLIAGATGAGKSIGLAALITSLLLRNTPKDLRFVMIDPKRVELTLFDSIPHLMCPVIKDTKEAAGVLRAVWREMDRRYDLLSEAGVRNIDGYNAKALEQDRMPYIVVVIDELADLMIQHRAEVETVIVRLAQLARAVGIHMVLATQRPSADIITGLIKANVPSRIAFAVSSGVDSSVILDERGAERLLGKGDMLFSPIGQPSRRVQGAFVSEQEVERVCRHWREQEKPAYVLSPIEDEPAPADSDDPEPFYEQAVEFAREKGQISTSMLQRKFDIGFQRASRILDRMEKDKVVGPRDGPRPRQVLPEVE